MARTLLIALPLLALTARAQAQERPDAPRSPARIQLALDHGYGFGSEGDDLHPAGDFVALGLDLRVTSDVGLGAVVRAGLAARPLSYALSLDVGVAQRIVLHARPRWGVELGLAIGPELAYGPFDQGFALAFGGFAMAHLDLRVDGLVVGIGVDAHALAAERHADPGGRDAPILTVGPVLRAGWDGGL